MLNRDEAIKVPTFPHIMKVQEKEEAKE